MAANKAPDVEEERVEIYIPRASANEDPNFQICINGVNFLLPKGQKSKVPAYVAAEYNRSLRAQEDYDMLVDAMIAQGNT